MINDDQKAFALTAALGFIEMVWQAERAINSKSARATRLERGIDQLIKLTDIYNPSMAGWPADKLAKACQLVDEMNERIKEVFGGDEIRASDTGTILCNLRETDPVQSQDRAKEAQ